MEIKSHTVEIEPPEDDTSCYCPECERLSRELTMCEYLVKNLERALRLACETISLYDKKRGTPDDVYKVLTGLAEKFPKEDQ